MAIRAAAVRVDVVLEVHPPESVRYLLDGLSSRRRNQGGVMAVPLMLLVWPQRPACRLLRAVRSLPAAVGLVELATLIPPKLAEALNHRR